MKRIVIVFVLAAVLGCNVFSAELGISGFVDVSLINRQGGNTSFGMGAFELDFESEIAKNRVFTGAIVVEGGAVGLGQTLADFKLKNEDKLGLQIGLLDMPFGIDYTVFATPDRKLITPPLTTELIMAGGWGDTGVNLYGKADKFNYCVYVVNGMGEAAGAPANQDADNNDAKTFGTHISVPLTDIELGVSYMQGAYLDNNESNILARAGIDIQYRRNALYIKGEFINAKESLPGANDNNHSGYYAHVQYDINDKVYEILRYGSWKPENGDAVTRITIGAGYKLEKNMSIKGEYQLNDETPNIDNNQLAVQLVTSF